MLGLDARHVGGRLAVRRHDDDLAALSLGSGMGAEAPSVLPRYVDMMIAAFDEHTCWRNRDAVQSDQGYHNMLLLTRKLETEGGLRVRRHAQGEGIVNTLGAMKSRIVPDEYKGATSLEDHWRARRADGHVINADGSLSPAVHQWDRWAEVLLKWVDSGVLYPKAISAEEQRFLDEERTLPPP